MLKNICSLYRNRCSVFTQTDFKMRSAKVRTTLLSGFLLLISSISLSSIGLAQGKDDSTRLQSGRLHSGRITRSFTEPIEQSVAASPEVGIVAESVVKEGDAVKVGAILATLNQTVLLESLEIAKARAESTARLDAAKSQLEMLTSQVEAVQSLVSGGHTNRFEVEQKQAEYQTAYAEYRSAEDELKLNKLEVNRIRAQIDDRIIKSPINGIVTEIHKQLGENVSNNEPQYATIVRVDELKVRFYLDADTLRNLSVNQDVKILVGREQTPNMATVTYVSPIIDPDSGLGRIDIKIDNPDLEIQSGIICFWSDENSTLSNAALTTDGRELILKR